MKSILLFGPINYMGYGIAFTNLVNKLVPKLKQRDIMVGIIPKGQPNVHEGAITQEVINAVNTGPMCSHKSPSFNMWHLHDMTQFCGSFRIGYPVFELPRLNPAEVNGVNSLDTIWVPSQWAKGIIEAHGGMNCKVVPLGVDVDTFCPSGESSPWKDDNYFTFVTVGKLEKRKGHELIFESMRMLGDQDKPVRLLINCINPFIREYQQVLTNQLSARGFTSIEQFDNFVRFKLDSNPNCVIDAITAQGLSNSQISQLYQAGNIGIFPYFAEGWNLPLLECMATGIPCIANPYSAPTEYLNEKNHISITDTRTTIANDGTFFNGTKGTWSVPKLMHLYELMLDCLNENKDYNDMSTECIKTARQFSWENAAEKFVTMLGQHEETAPLVQ